MQSIAASWQSGSGNSGTIFSQNLTYDPASNLISLTTTQNAAGSKSGGTETSNFCYDEQNRLVWAGNSGTQPGAGKGTCGSATLADTISGANYADSYVYTHLGQLWQAPCSGGSTQYQYLYCNTQPHELTGLYALGSTCSSKSGQGYASSYDAFGNVTTRTTSGTTGTLTYDLLDHFTQWYVGANNQEQYLYDASGQRMLRRVTNSTSTTLITYPFGIEEHQYSGTGTNQANTYYYFLAGHLLGSLDSNGTQFYLTDALGSLISSFTNAQGGARMKSNQVFGPYGNARYTAGNLNTAKGFIGQYSDNTGLDYFHARYYDPVAGVFLSADTAQGNAQGMNPYAYVNSNPETYSDPSGRYYVTPAPLNQKGGAAAYVIPGSDLITTITQDVNYSGSYQGVSGSQTLAKYGNLQVHVQTLQSAIDPYNPDTDVNNSPLAKLSRELGWSDLENAWGNPNATWQDKLGAVWNFISTNANNAFQLAMIFGGGPEGDAEDLLAACGGLSFASSTLVATSKGEQAIGTMQVGEQVWAYNPKTHKMELEPVLHVWINRDSDLVDLTLTTTTSVQHGKLVTKTSETLHTNKKHPFLTKEKGFLPVGQITVGMHVLRADGTYGLVTGWKVVAGTQVMYNLEVAQDHTYTVGTDQWVVHNFNCGPGSDGLGFADQALRDDHFVKHNAEFNPPFSSAEGYENGAVDFMTEPERPGLHEGFRSRDKAILRVDDSTGWFGVMRNDTINTFFIPDPAGNGGFSPVDYFLKQIDELFF